MKQMFMALTIITGMSVAAMSQSPNQEKLKKHHCTAACTKGKHVYAHGEKGHVCTDACKKAKV
ncbi:MAG TPA: hypothetical protein VNX68_05585 [Nitrosopumilaceae archaeon]|jgi:hypothetical protein|nr:hypothetical protein [Nitrosopumilaceae archaeon]